LFGKTVLPTDPVPAAVIPSYVADGIDRQDADTLKAIEEYARARRKYLAAIEAAEIEAAELAEENEELVDVEDSDGGTVVIKKVPCGKDCEGCPHGPYKYVVRREGETVNWNYRGRVDDTDQ
jgi:hypothetical protein